MKKIFPLLIIALTACYSNKQETNFGYDLNFLKTNTTAIVLNNNESYVIVSPELQGRVLTSSSQGLEGRSYGWFNHKLIKNGLLPENNNIGGEDRLLFGPEYGEFSMVFRAGDPQNGNTIHMQSAIDTESFDLVKHDGANVHMKKQMSLINYSNYEFKVDFKRHIQLLNKSEIEKSLGIELNKTIDHVGFVSKNTMINRNDSAWSMETGLLSIWNIGGFHPGDKLTAVLPLSKPAESIVSYWSEVDESRLKVIGDKAFYKGDARHMHKIGVPPSLALSVMGSYDAEKEILTLVKYTFNNDTIYVNSQWDNLADPYKGDVTNVFNDGPHNGQAPFGPFYELESQSSSKELAPGDSIVHEHYTFHFEGDLEQLNNISINTLGVSLDEINAALE